MFVEAQGSLSGGRWRSAHVEKLEPQPHELPPSLRFEDCPAAEFFEALRDRWQGAVALEPRHASWFGPDAEELMKRHRVGRVAADPVRGYQDDPPLDFPHEDLVGRLKEDYRHGDSTSWY